MRRLMLTTCGAGLATFAGYGAAGDLQLCAFSAGVASLLLAVA